MWHKSGVMTLDGGEVDTDRKVSIQVSIGTGLDPTASDDVTGITPDDSLGMSNPSQILDVNYALTSGLATFEGDGIPTAVSAGIVAPPLTTSDYPPEVGIWSASISGSDSTMDWSLEVQLSQAHTSAFSVHSSGTEIRKLRLQYYNGTASVRDVVLESDGSSVTDDAETTFDRVIITVQELSGPYLHARIAEIEFGATTTLSSSVIGETASIIRETDLLRVNAPIDEFTFSVINVDGTFDDDNPDSMISLLELRNPVTLAIVTEDSAGRTSVPMGRYYISERQGTDTDLRISAQDARSILQATVRAITLSTAQSVGETLGDILEELDIPYAVETSALDVMPTADATMNAQEWDLLSQINFIRQFYGVTVIPDRDGLLHVMAEPSGDSAPTQTAAMLISFPAPDNSQTYNGVVVTYGTEGAQETVDLRASTTEAKNYLTITNPLVVTQADAQRVAQETAGRIYSQVYSAQALGDAAVDPGDIMAVAGRWTQSSPVSYRLTSIEYDYDGGFLMTLKGVKYSAQSS